MRTLIYKYRTSPDFCYHYYHMDLTKVFLVLLSFSLTAASYQPDILRSVTGSGSHLAAGLPCESWRLAAETNNLRDWEIPASCEGYVGNYMLGSRYREDSQVVAQAAAEFAASLKLADDGRDVWVFDIDETSLSNLPFFAYHGFGEINGTALQLHMAKGSSPSLPESLILYKKLLSRGIQIVFLTGRSTVLTEITAVNLKNSGYPTWLKLILKTPGTIGSTVAFKSAERQKLVNSGYRIVGNIGDQWSDILGVPEGRRTFKLPNPIYYAP